MMLILLCICRFSGGLGDMGLVSSVQSRSLYCFCVEMLAFNVYRLKKWSLFAHLGFLDAIFLA